MVQPLWETRGSFSKKFNRDTNNPETQLFGGRPRELETHTYTNLCIRLTQYDLQRPKRGTQPKCTSPGEQINRSIPHWNVTKPLK